jgi:tetratricopeptide (TPR) repeat protein
LHWLLGLVRLAQGDAAEAAAEFNREIAGGTGQLYGAEFVMNARDGAGFACLRAGDAGAAIGHFEQALALFPDHARSLVGLGAALAADRRRADAAAALSRAQGAIDALRKGGRGAEATLAEAFLHATAGRPDESNQCLTALLDRSEMPFTGWTIPVEPLLAPVRNRPAFQTVMATLASRAR